MRLREVRGGSGCTHTCNGRRCVCVRSYSQKCKRQWMICGVVSKVNEGHLLLGGSRLMIYWQYLWLPNVLWDLLVIDLRISVNL